MAYWDFKAVELDGTQPRLVDLSEQQAARVYLYERSLIAAVRSEVASAPMSGYLVKASLNRNGITVAPMPAGNIEYGLCQALHGEETAVAAFRSWRDQSREGGFTLAFAAHAAGSIPKCCGNCRDILRDALGTDIEIVHGHPDGGAAVVVRMDQYLVSEHWSAGTAHDFGTNAEQLIRTTWEQGQRLTNDAFSPDGMYPERKYVAVVGTEYNRYFGGRQVYCDYHPIYAIRDALRAAERAGDAALRYIWVVCQNDSGLPPDVMYKDRQHLHAFNMQTELVSGQTQDPPVYLATIRADGRGSIPIWRTRVKSWLPLPFSAQNFADMAKLEQYYKEKFV